MSGVLELAGLQGTNPLGFLAAVGVLDVLTRAGRAATLAFADELVPIALVEGAEDVDDLVSILDQDRATWTESVVLNGPLSHPLDDAKPDSRTAAAWAGDVADTLSGGRAGSDLYCALVAEGAVDGAGKAKPTHLHFTAGQQRFLVTARELVARVDLDRLREAVAGPWRDDSTLKSFRWDGRGSRPYAMRASDPSKIQPPSVPGADWLALLGLASLPVRAVVNRYTGSLALETTACEPRWKQSAFRWPLWSVAIGLPVVRSLLSDSGVVGTETKRRRATLSGPPLVDVLGARGVLRVLEAPIRRTDQGGYGNFGGAVTLVKARPPP